MSPLSFYLAHLLPEVAAGLTPVHQWKRDASDKNTCNYPPTLLSLGGDWTAGPFPTRKGTAHGQTCQSPAKPSITADTVPSTCSRTLRQAPPTWDPTRAASPVKCGLGELDGRSTPASLYAQTGTAQPDSDAHSQSQRWVIHTRQSGSHKLAAWGITEALYSWFYLPAFCVASKFRRELHKYLMDTFFFFFNFFPPK